MPRSLLFLFLAMPVAALADPPDAGGPPTGTTTTVASPPPASGQTPPQSLGRKSCLSRHRNVTMPANVGNTMMDLTVTAEGIVTDVTVSKSSGSVDLDDAAVACTRTWTYKPATKDGVPVQLKWKAQVVWKMGH
jgi:protein TonB